MPKIPNKTYYEILGVTEYASVQKIKSAYRKLAKQTHPDRNKKSTAEKEFLAVKEAYDVLTDPQKKLSYDDLLSSIRESSDKGNADIVSTSLEESVVERYSFIVLRKVAICLAGGGLGMMLGMFSSPLFLMLFPSVIPQYQRSWYIIVSIILWIIICLITPYRTIRKMIKYVLDHRSTWDKQFILRCVISFLLYLSVVCLIVNIFNFDAP